MAVLIDLHVRPLWAQPGSVDTELVAVQARDRGLDGVLIAALDAPLTFGDTTELARDTGVDLFCGVELVTDCGVLVCIPRSVDAWYTSAGWQQLRSDAADEPRYAAARVIGEFVARGGVAIAVPQESTAEGSAWSVPIGVAAVAALTGLQGRLNEGAARLAHRARIASVGGSGCEPGDSQFGRAATLFASPVSSQESLVDGLRSARAWPVEIGVSVQRKSSLGPESRRAAGGDKSRPDRQLEALARADGGEGTPADRQLGGDDPPPERAGRHGPKPHPESSRAHSESGRAHSESGRAHSESGRAHSESGRAHSESGRAHSESGRSAREPTVKPLAAAKPARGRHDAPERPGDNRGNRLNRDEILRGLWTPVHGDEVQPSADPVAMMYGVESRRQHRRRDYNDLDLDRTYNGNRARGSDPNIMALPSFDEMRPDRQQIQVLFAPNEEKHDLEDSVALRFALAGLRRSGVENGPAQPSRGRPRGSGGGGNQRRRR